jgi:hypothetical protein
MIVWLSNWIERRKLRRKVDWHDCVWSPQKAAEKQLVRVMADQWSAAIGLRLELEMQRVRDEWARSVRISQAIKMTAAAKHSQAMAEYAKHEARLRAQATAPPAKPRT